jgi:hypothetical protein
MTEVAGERDDEADLIPRLRADVRDAVDHVLERYRLPVAQESGMADPVRSEGLTALIARSLRATDELLVALPAAGSTDLRSTTMDCVGHAIVTGHGVRVVVGSGGSDGPVDTVQDRIAAMGARVHTVATLPTWLLLVGSHTVVLPARRAGYRPADALSIRGGGAPTLARWTFERLWRASAASPGELSAVQRRVLRCLAANFKDEQAARHLEMSVRTYRRNVTSLCMHLDAASRFEAGVKAARAGLI